MFPEILTILLLICNLPHRKLMCRRISMRGNTIRFAWHDTPFRETFHTGVSLHGHTMHSKESLSFLPRYLHHVPGVSQITTHYERRIDLTRAWWTPPLTPASALHLERKQIARLDLHPLVSLTDHDDIHAGLSLGVTESSSEVPLAVEWTVPYQRSIFHLGVHNIPRTAAALWMDAMTEYTSAPCEEHLPAILDEFSRHPDVLIVLNHPYWIEEGVIETDHEPALDRILRECSGWFDAIEFNGTRPWRENARAMELAALWGRPLIAGGDRHAGEPSACINMTNAQTFAEFVCEIHAGHSSILILPQYREPMAQRVLEAIRDILREYPEYPDRRRWSDRIWYRCDDGADRTVSQICHGHEPWILSAVASTVQFIAATHFRQALRFALTWGNAGREELHP